MTNGVAYTSEELDGYKKAIIEWLLSQPGGTFSGACMHAKAPISTAYAWRKDDPDFDTAVIEARKLSDEMGGDMAESKLMKAINSDELTAIIFYLKTKHKARGYIERTEQNLGGQPNNPVATVNASCPDIQTLIESLANARNAGAVQESGD